MELAARLGEAQKEIEALKLKVARLEGVIEGMKGYRGYYHPWITYTGQMTTTPTTVTTCEYDATKKAWPSGFDLPG